MRVLVIGSGGREHAICWRLAQSEQLAALFCAPGNPGTARIARNVPLAADNTAELVRFAIEERIDLTIVGPEAPLCAGIADRFAAQGLLVAGPSQAAAALEGSKIFAKQFMARHGIPTAPFAVFERAGQAKDYILANSDARVVKADGLAGGKGVIVASDQRSAIAAVDDLLAGHGGPLVVERCLHGEEVSVIALCDGERGLLLASSQDHKRALDGDRGLNTGGMGAYSPAPVLTEALERTVVQRVVQPTLDGMAAEGRAFRGVLYVGLMIVDGEPHVLEYNCRFGDPETQALMVRLRSDLAQLSMEVARGQLETTTLEWDARASICVVMAADGYPGHYETGHVIEGVDVASAFEDVVVFQAGTRVGDGRLVTAGGRVLGVTALGLDLGAARHAAYRAVESITWPGARYRRDIGARGASASRPAAIADG